MNMTSHLSDDMLNAWIDGIATDDERRMIAGHLESCAACRSELDSLLLVKQLLSSLPEPALPRSFQLTPDQARKPTPIRGTAAPSTVVRMLPVVRILSIAAVLAVLVLGSVTALGPVNNFFGTNETDSSSETVTNTAPGASKEANPALRANAPGEVVDQGQAASSSNSAMTAMGNGLQQATGDAEGGLSSLEIATLSTGIFAVIMVGLWIVLSKLGRARPVA